MQPLTDQMSPLPNGANAASIQRHRSRSCGSRKATYSPRSPRSPRVEEPNSNASYFTLRPHQSASTATATNNSTNNGASGSPGNGMSPKYDLETAGRPRALTSLRRYDTHKEPSSTGDTSRPQSPSRSQSAYAPNRVPSSHGLNNWALKPKAPIAATLLSGDSDDHRRAQYLAQEKIYRQKISNSMMDDYYVKELSPVGAELEDDSEDDESVSELQPEVVGFGGVGTSFDDEYTDLASQYPFLEANYAQEDIDGNPEHFRERLEWQAMLSSVLTGEVFRSEKKRLGAPPSESFKDRMAEPELWMELRAHLSGRTLAEQKRYLDLARRNTDMVLHEVQQFKADLTADYDSISKEVEVILRKLAKCESHYMSIRSFKTENPIYGSPEFQRRVDGLVSWKTVSDAVNQELGLLRAWTGNDDIDPTRPRQRNAEEPMDEQTSLVERILKRDDLTSVFEFRITQRIGPLIEKARQATLEFSEMFFDLGLPPFHEGISLLMSFPIKLMQEIIRLRLNYARKLVNPTMMMIDQMIVDFQLYISISLLVMDRNQDYAAPVFEKGWMFPSHVDESFNVTILDCVSYYFDLLQKKFLDMGSRNKLSLYKAIRDSEQLEVEYAFLLDVARYVPRGHHLVAEQFSLLESKLLTRLLNYWEQQMKGPSRWTELEIERWFSETTENVRSFHRKLLRFYRILCATYESCIDYSIQSSKVKQLMKRLEETGHFLVFTRTYEKYGIYTIADPSLMNDPVKIKDLISGYCRPQEQLEEIDSPSYVFIFCIQEPLVWEGEIFNVEVPYSEIDIRPGRMRLVSEGDSSELKKTRQAVSKLMEGSDILVAVEARCAIPRVNHEFARIRRLVYRLSVSVLNGVTNMRYKLRPYECQENVNSLFMFAREFSQRGISVMESNKRGSIAIKLINLCIEWVSFICDDCLPSDYRAFRWTVVAMEFAMVMTRGVNIVAISDDQFAKLRAKVADCVTLLISHFDIMGARSRAAEQRLLSRSVFDKRLANVDMSDDEELFDLVKEGTLKKLKEIDEKREHMVGGKVLDDTNTDTDFLDFVANSFSNVSIRWQQGRFIGAGAFGSVYAAVNLDTGGVMAVKEIRLQDSQSIRHVLKSIKDEMMVLEILNHPNVVQYYGVEVHRDKIFIFMEYCQGGSLAGLLEYGRIEDEQVIQVYTLQMLEGLAYLHSCGVVHRDIKPENILLDHMGVVKFVDFGAAKVIARTGKTIRGSAAIGIGAKTKLNSMTGTPMYMSPEVITGQDTGRQGSIDIWSTGCCVLEMATGRRPWANLDNEWAIMYHIAAGHLPQLPSPDQLSEEGRQFLMRSLERDPNKRPSAIELLNDPWIVNIRNIVLGTVAGAEEGGASRNESPVESRHEPIAERQALERVIQAKASADASWEGVKEGVKEDIREGTKVLRADAPEIPQSQ